MDKSEIDVLDYTPKDSQYEYYRPRGQKIVRTDEKYKVPVLILVFHECATKFVRIWPLASLQRIFEFG